MRRFQPTPPRTRERPPVREHSAADRTRRGIAVLAPCGISAFGQTGPHDAESTLMPTVGVPGVGQAVGEHPGQAVATARIRRWAPARHVPGAVLVTNHPARPQSPVACPARLDPPRIAPDGPAGARCYRKLRPEHATAGRASEHRPALDQSVGPLGNRRSEAAALLRPARRSG